MSSASTERAVLVVAADLVFQSRLEGVVRATGHHAVREGEAPIAVVELARPGAQERIETLLRGGARVIAFGPHVHATALDAAARAGAIAVPNARVEQVLRAMLTEE